MTKIPVHLKAGGRRFWRDVTESYRFESHHLLLVLRICESIDREWEARQVLERETMFITDRFGRRMEHPAVKTRQHEASLQKTLIRELGLDLSQAEEFSRPPGIVGIGGRR